MTWFAQRMTFVKSPWGKWSVYMGNMEKKQLIMTYSCLNTEIHQVWGSSNYQGSQ